jgi:hypothetical protein
MATSASRVMDFARYASKIDHAHPVGPWILPPVREARLLTKHQI